MSGALKSSQLTKLQLMLSLLPIPPIPVTFSVDMTGFSDKKAKDALVIALNALNTDGKDADATRSSHQIIAGLSVFMDWCEWGKANLFASRVKKDGANMRLIKSTLDTGGQNKECSVSEDVAYDVFFDATRDWIDSYLPSEVTFKLGKVSPNTVQHEDILHIGMAHYCQGQGFMYSKKGSDMSCPVHANIVQQLAEMVRNAKEDCDSVDARKLDSEDLRREHQELAEIYSKHSYAKLLTLCFSRIHRDCLYGHPKAGSSAEPVQMARDLLSSAEKMHKSVMEENNISEPAPNQIVIAQDTTPSDLVLCGTLNSLILGDEDTHADEAAARALIQIVASCASGGADTRYWNSLALNLENSVSAADSGDAALRKACLLVNVQAFAEILAPALALVDSADRNIQAVERIRESLAVLQQARSRGEDGEGTGAPVTARSELGLIIQAAASDFDAVRLRVLSVANEICRASQVEEERHAAAIFYATGVGDGAESAERIQEID